MTDGSHLGTTAGRALKTIIAGEPQPAKDEKDTPEGVHVRLMQCPLPGEGLRIWDRTELDEDMRYSLAADCIARAMLETSDAIHRETDYDAAWNRAKERWPNLDDWIGGASGFQVGFAWNLVRYVNGWGETRNPAML